MQIFTPRLTSLNENEVRRYARAENLNKSLIETAVSDALVYIKPKGIFNIFDYDCQNSSVISENKKIFLKGNSIKKHLHLCEKISILALTVGEDTENQISSMSENGEYVRALLLDAAATEAVEESADLLEKIIEREAKKEGFNMTFRFSPGYGDFPITMQKEILELAGGDKIGISLTSSLMLIPRKSITAVIGFKRENNIVKRQNCDNCNKTDCNFRKKGDIYDRDT